MRVGARSKPNPETTGCKREGATRWDCAFFRLHGADVGIRTPDLLITNQLLYQLSYIGLPSILKGNI